MGDGFRPICDSGDASGPNRRDPMEPVTRQRLILVKVEFNC